MNQLKADVLKLIATPTEFKNWLKTKPDWLYVGAPCDPEFCPVGEFLKSQLATRVRVGWFAIKVHDPSTDRWVVVDSPRWVCELVGAIDGLGPIGGRITAHKCLRLLERLGMD